MPKLSHPSFTRQRVSLRAAIAAAIVAATALTLVPVASAGQYRVFNCRKPNWEVANGSDWVSEAAGGGLVMPDNCLRDGQRYTYLGNAQRSTTAFSGFGLHLRSGLSVQRLRADRWVKLLPGADNGASVQYDLLRGSDDDAWNWSALKTVETCRLTAPCSGWAYDGAAGSSSVDVEFPGGTTFLGFAVSCRGEAWGACGGGDNGRAHLRINAIDLTIEDSDSPVLAQPGGALLNPGPVRGILPMTVQASDHGAGVYQLIVEVDGEEFSRTRPDPSASCADAGVFANTDLEFEHAEPCALSVTATTSIDTKQLSEGRHELSVRVRDAAGNLSDPFSKTLEIDNVPPPSVLEKPTISGPGIASGLRPGDKIVATNGTWTGPMPVFKHRWQRNSPSGVWADIPNGVTASYIVGVDDVNHQVRVVVTANAGEGAVEVASDPTATIKSGAAIIVQSDSKAVGGNVAGGNGAGGNPATGQLVVDREQRTVDIRHGAKIVITGRLVDADGNPIADAAVDVFEQIAVVAAPWNKVDTIKTDSQGGYVYRPKTTASRRLRFAYSEKREVSDYRATREVFVSVTAGMTIKARSRVVPRLGLIKLSGKVIVDQLPARGAWVEVQVLDAKVWRTVATRRLSAEGRWVFKHRLRGASATRFTFRSRLRVAGDLPTAEAKSTPLKVRVR